MISFRPLFIILGLTTAATSAGGCFVHPTSVVVAVLERVLLSCTTHEGDSITSWHIEINIKQRKTVYAAPIYKQDGTVNLPAEIAQGYFVTHPVDNETTLQMKETILSQAGLYVCTCDLQNTAASTVVVLDAEPKFSKNCSAADGEPVTFSCSISFNASSDVSCELKIANASGYTVATGNVATVSGGLIQCSLKHTIIAVVSSDQWHTCHVTLSIKDRGMIYSRVLNAIVELDLEPGDSTSDFSLGDVGMIFNSSALEHRKEEGRHADAYQVLAFPIALTIACVIIAILTATIVVLYRKPRQRKKSTSDANNIYTEGCPTHYAPLDPQTASDEQQREPYTEIQLPIQSQRGLRTVRSDMNTYIRNDYEVVT